MHPLRDVRLSIGTIAVVDFRLLDLLFKERSLLNIRFTWLFSDIRLGDSRQAQLWVFTHYFLRCTLASVGYLVIVRTWRSEEGTAANDSYRTNGIVLLLRPLPQCK